MGNCNTKACGGGRDAVMKAKQPPPPPSDEGSESKKVDPFPDERGVEASKTSDAAIAKDEGEQLSFSIFVAFLRVPKFKKWHKLFMEHSLNCVIGDHANSKNLSMPRSAYCNEAATVVYRDVRNPKTCLVVLAVTDTSKFLSVTQSDDFIALHRELGIEEALPMKKLADVLTVPQHGDDLSADGNSQSAAACPSFNCNNFKISECQSHRVPSDYVVFVEVEDFDWWYAGFLQNSATHSGSWGFKVSMVRRDICDDSKTRVYRCISAPSSIAVCLFDVNATKFEELLLDLSFKKLQGALGEKSATRVVRLMVDDEQANSYIGASMWPSWNLTLPKLLPFGSS